jgi:hypothetical protein
MNPGVGAASKIRWKALWVRSVAVVDNKTEPPAVPEAMNFWTH